MQQELTLNVVQLQHARNNNIAVAAGLHVTVYPKKARVSGSKRRVQ